MTYINTSGNSTFSGANAGPAPAGLSPENKAAFEMESQKAPTAESAWHDQLERSLEDFYFLLGLDQSQELHHDGGMA